LKWTGVRDKAITSRKV